jgi:hypothetical protein
LQDLTTVPTSPRASGTERREAFISPLGYELLEFLRDLNRVRGGYELHGVAGWATAPEIKQRVIQRRRSRNAPRFEFSGGAEELGRLAKRGLLTRRDARIPGASAPVWLYRITDTGARCLPGEHRKVRPPGEEPDDRVFVRPGMRAALDALRHANANPPEQEWVPGDPGWATSRELSAWLESLPRRRGVAPPIFFTDDISACVRAGLAVRRDLSRPIYRITRAGKDLKPLEWREVSIPA